MFFPRTALTSAAAALLLCCTLSGCKSAQDKAIETAKEQAAATGQAQQVVSNDGKGNITTTTVQPPDPTTKVQAVTSTTGPAPVASAPGTVMTADGSAATGAPVAPAVNQPIIKPADVQIPAGTGLAIRVNQHISVKTTPAGSRFTGEIAEPIVSTDNRVIVPRGTPVAGTVVASKKRGHFKGSSILSLQLTSMTLGGTEYPLETGSFTRTKKGKGKRTAGWIGGGAGAGMLIGGLASGGVGLLIGGLAGGGAGTAVAGLTGNGDIDLPAESLVRFRLADDLSVVPPAAGTATAQLR